MQASESGPLKCAFTAIGALRAPITVAIITAVALIIPGQTHELYRHLLLDFGSNSAAISLGLVALAVLSASYYLIFQHAIQRTPSHRDECVREYRWFLNVLVAALAASPFWAMAYGLRSARLSATCPSAPQSCEVLQTLHPGLDATLAFASTVATLVGCACILLVLGVAFRSNFRQARSTSRLPTFGLLAIAFTVFVGIAIAVAALPVAVLSSIGAFFFLFLLATLLLVFLSALSAICDSTGVPVVAVLAVAIFALSLISRDDNQTIRMAETDLKLESHYAGKAFVDWLSARRDLDAYIASGKPYPVFVVAANGGGTYAAYHAALTLARIQDSCPRFAQHLFAISGVSGGSLGGSVFAALAATRAKNEQKIECLHRPKDSGFLQDATQRFFSHDLLTPLLAAGMYPDLLQRLSPWRVPSFDRARHLERAMEAAWASAVPENPDVLQSTVRALWSTDGSTPALILNTTEVRSGGVEVIAPFYLELDAFGSQTGLWLGTDVPLRISTAIGMSARFPWLSPPAGLSLGGADSKPQSWQFVDGAYFENSGIETAHQLILGLQGAIERGNKEPGREAHELLVPVKGRNARVRVAFRLLSLRTLDSVDTASVHGELLTPITALLNARFKRASLARFYAKASLCPRCASGEISLADSFREAVLDFRDHSLPLGWILSRQSLDYVRANLTVRSDCPIPLGSESPVTADAHNVNACFYQSIIQDLS